MPYIFPVEFFKVFVVFNNSHNYSFKAFDSPVVKTITNGRDDAMKRPCSDTLMHFHNKNRPFSESH